MVDEVLAEAGRIDLLVNNAGIGLLGGAEESSTAQAQALFDVNVFGVLRVTNAVLPTMRTSKEGQDHQYELGAGFDSGSLLRAVCVDEACASKAIPNRLTTNCAHSEFEWCWSNPAYTRTSFEENLTRPDRLLDVYDLARAGTEAVMRRRMKQVMPPKSSPRRS